MDRHVRISHMPVYRSPLTRSQNSLQVYQDYWPTDDMYPEIPFPSVQSPLLQPYN